MSEVTPRQVLMYMAGAPHKIMDEPFTDMTRHTEGNINIEGRRFTVVIKQELNAKPEPKVEPIQEKITRAKVELYKPNGRYYTEEEWLIPDGAIGPYDMINSPEFRRIDGGAVVISAQEPWGYPHIFPGVTHS